MTGTDDDFGSMLDAFEKEGGGATRGPKVGDVVRGRILSIGADSVFVDLGGKSEGVLEREQVVSGDGELRVAIGDEVEARVVDTGGRTGSIVLRIGMGKGPDAAAELGQAFELGLAVEGVVTGTNKGGVEVQVAGMRGFCPISQLDNRFVEDAETYVGQKLSFRITRLEGGRRPNIVLSRKALIEEERAVRAAVVRETLEVGATMAGIVSSLKPYGVFVDLGGLEGMIHVSELSHTRVDDPAEFLGPGQEVTVKVLRIEPAAKGKEERVALSMKALTDDPWTGADRDFSPGKRISGTVARLTNFGAFVEVALAIEGLIHVSELANRRIKHPRDVVAVGDTVQVEVISFEPQSRRLSLSLARIESADANAEERANIDDHSPHAPKSLGTFGDLLKKTIK